MIKTCCALNRQKVFYPFNEFSQVYDSIPTYQFNSACVVFPYSFDCDLKSRTMLWEENIGDSILVALVCYQLN